MAKIKTSDKQRRRLAFVFGAVCLLFTGLAVRLGYHMIIKADEYSAKAIRQQTKDSIVLATRGEILDRNHNEFAISATANTIWVRPDTVKGNGKTEKEIEKNIKTEALTLSEILGMEYKDVLETITAEKKLIKLAKNIDDEVAQTIRDAKCAGIEIVEDAKRYYPLGAFASHVIGATTDDNVGLLGLELYYNNYLSGINGRMITSKDGGSNALSYGTSKYYAAEDGSTVVSTIDENIQYIVENRIAEAKETCEASRVMCMIQDPKTGEILAMAQTEEYDPNDPRTPLDEKIKAGFDNMNDQTKVNYWNSIWRNFCICDTYEPGSTFKLITTAIALDEGVTNKTDKFYCPGKVEVADATLKCWCYPKAHYDETLVQAVENSCNPAMITLVQRLGLTKYYEGLDSFGLTTKTGVDYPGESVNILQDKSTAGPVGLATMGYGQGIAVTPVNLVTAISSIANDGKLMQPHFLKEVLDGDGNLTYSYEPTVTSISMSQQTADDMLEIMGEVVDEGGGGNARIPGYLIGGKTGTAQKPEGGAYSKTDFYCSFIGIAPLDDPRFTILVVVDSPRVNISGSAAAAPCAREIMRDIFVYLGIEPHYTDEELVALNKTLVTVPDLTGKSGETAVGILGGRGLAYSFAPSTEQYVNLAVVDQYPHAGEEVTRGTIVTLYYEEVLGENDTVDMEMVD